MTTSSDPTLEGLESELASMGEASAPLSDPPSGTEPDSPDVEIGTGPAPDPVELLDSQGLAQLVRSGFDFVAARRGAHWKLTDGEVAQLEGALEAITDKYDLSWLERFAPEITLGIVVFAIVEPRSRMDAEREGGADD